jgi:hypothetical protein
VPPNPKNQQEPSIALPCENGDRLAECPDPPKARWDIPREASIALGGDSPDKLKPNCKTLAETYMKLHECVINHQEDQAWHK